MAKKKKKALPSSSIVTQANQLVTARYFLPLAEQRLILSMIARIHPDDEDFKPYRIGIGEFAEFIGVDKDSAYRECKKTTKNLLSRVLEIQEPGRLLQANWVSSAEYIDGDGMVNLCFDPLLKPYLLKLKGSFTRCRLEMLLSFKSQYTMRFYSILKQYELLREREIELDALREMLGIRKEQYKLYSNFKKDILESTQKELAEKSDLYFEFDEIKYGRRIGAINLRILRKTLPGHENGDILPLPAPSPDDRAMGGVRAIFDDAPKNVSIERLVGLGVTRVAAVQLADVFDGERIDRAIAYTEEKQKTGDLKNQAAFVVTAIQKDFTDTQAQEKAKKVETVRLGRELEQLKEQWEAIKTRYGEWKTGALEEALLEMTAEEADEYRRQFSEAVNSGVMHEVFSKNKGAENRHFLLYLRQQLPLDTLDVWAQKNAVDLSVFPYDMRYGV
jgi:hypothetical protein